MLFLLFSYIKGRYSEKSLTVACRKTHVEYISLAWGAEERRVIHGKYSVEGHGFSVVASVSNIRHAVAIRQAVTLMRKEKVMRVRVGGLDLI